MDPIVSTAKAFIYLFFKKKIMIRNNTYDKSKIITWANPQILTVLGVSGNPFGPQESVECRRT